MPKPANFTATVTIAWTNRRGCDADCEVNVDYTFDGDDLRITASELLGPCDLGEYETDELIWEAVNERADEAYAEWLADYGEYLRDGMLDRALAEMVPA